MSASPPLLVRADEAVDVDGLVRDAWVLAEDGHVAARGSGETWREHADGAEVVHAERLTPGFVDMHVHGGGGHAHEDGPAAVLGSLRAHHAHGTTRSVVSLASAPVEELEERLRVVAALRREHTWIVGSHLEGPFLSVARRGAHREEVLVDPGPGMVARLLAAADGSLAQVTIDPLRAGSARAQRELLEAGVVVAVGHTDASYDQAGAAFDAGATVLTHAFNAMPGLHHREPGPVLAALEREGVVLELILDGRHVHPAVASLLLRTAPGRVALVSDAMAAAGAGDGEYDLAGATVVVRDGTARLSGSGAIAGSALLLDDALRLGLSHGIDAVTLVTALTHTPSRCLGEAHRWGRLAPGYAADLVTWDGQWRMTASWSDGHRLA